MGKLDGLEEERATLDATLDHQELSQERLTAEANNLGFRITETRAELEREARTEREHRSKLEDIKNEVVSFETTLEAVRTSTRETVKAHEEETIAFEQEVAQLEADAHFGKNALDWCLREVQRLKYVRHELADRVQREHVRFGELLQSLFQALNGVMGNLSSKAALSCWIIESMRELLSGPVGEELSERARVGQQRQLLLSLKQGVTDLRFLTWGVAKDAPELEERVRRIISGEAADDDKELWAEAEAEVEALLAKRRATLELREILSRKSSLTDPANGYGDKGLHQDGNATADLKAMMTLAHWRGAVDERPSYDV